jgi:hypothetical protein
MPDQNQPQQAPYSFGFGSQDGATDPIPYAGAQKLGNALAMANNLPAAVQATAPPPATLFGLRPVQAQALNMPTQQPLPQRPLPQLAPTPGSRPVKQGSIIPGN